MSSRIAVLGPGGVGGLVAAALARAGEDVVVVARPSTAEVIAERGLQVRSERLGDFTAHPAVTDTLNAPVETLFVAPKATVLDAALDRVSAQPALVVPLLNGLDHLDVLRERFGPERVAAGVIRVESTRVEPGVIEHTSPFLRIDTASGDAGIAAALSALAQRLEAAGVPAQVGESEAAVMWGKLCRLNALALATSAFDLPLGPIRSTPELADQLWAAVAEGAAVADAEGAGIEARSVRSELEDAHAELRSSMQRDLAAGREPELDAIAGAVLRAGARHGISTPTVARLAAQVAARAGVTAPTV
jgi:2-dehydropantoate 2-reductase